MHFSRAAFLLFIALSMSACNGDSSPEPLASSEPPQARDSSPEARNPSEIAQPSRVSGPDIAGVQLGMSPEEVEAKLKEFDPNIRIEPISRVFNYTALGKHYSTDRMVVGLVGTSTQGHLRIQISAGFSHPPNPPQAVMVSRSDTQRTATTSEEAYVATLIEKYGQPARDYIGTPSRGLVLPRVLEWPIAGGTNDCGVRLGAPGDPILKSMVQDGRWMPVPTPEFAQNCASVFRYTLTGDPVTKADGVIADVAAMAKAEFEAQAWLEELSAEQSQAGPEQPKL